MTVGETKEMVEKKSRAVLDGHLMAEKTKDELWEECVSLKEDLKTEQILKKHFKIENNKAQRTWDNAKRSLEETKARLREKLRLKQRADKCRWAETEEQKLKLLETAHHDEICGLKVAANATNSKSQKEHVESEFELQKKMHNLQLDKGEKESRTKIFIGKLKQKQKDELRELNESYEKQVRVMEAQFKNKMKIMAEENNKKIQTELNQIDTRMKERTKSIVSEHDKVWKDLNKFIERKPCGYLEREKLQRQLEVAKEKDKQLDRRMVAAVQENKRLTETLQDMEPKLCESRQELSTQRKAMAKSLKRGKKDTVHLLAERRHLRLKHQQVEMKHIQTEQENDELQQRQTEDVLDMQQKSSLKAMVLERKIKAVIETHEKEQLKLWVALAFGQGDQTAAKNIKELLESKDAIIKALKDDLSQNVKEYDDLVKKAAALDISVDKWLPRDDIKKCIRNVSEAYVPSECKNFDSLIQKLMALCISEDNPVLKDPAGAESRQ